MEYVFIVVFGSIALTGIVDQFSAWAVEKTNSYVWIHGIMSDVNPVIKNAVPTKWTLVHQFLPIWNIIHSIYRYVKVKKALKYYIQHMKTLDQVQRPWKEYHDLL